jgi:transcriptional regulator with XRE-family HTH domain
MNDMEQDENDSLTRRDGWPHSQLENFRKNVRARRERLGLSQSELAAAVSDMGVPMVHQTIYRVEVGPRAVRLEEAAAISEALDATLVELVESPEVATMRQALDAADKSLTDLSNMELVKAQRRVAEIADGLEDSGGLDANLRQEVSTLLAQSVMDSARWALERDDSLAPSPDDGAFKRFWKFIQRETMAALPGVRLWTQESDQQTYEFSQFDPAKVGAGDVYPLLCKHGEPPTAGTIEAILANAFAAGVVPEQALNKPRSDDSAGAAEAG